MARPSIVDDEEGQHVDLTTLGTFVDEAVGIVVGAVAQLFALGYALAATAAAVLADEGGVTHAAGLRTRRRRLAAGPTLAAVHLLPHAFETPAQHIVFAAGRGSRLAVVVGARSACRTFGGHHTAPTQRGTVDAEVSAAMASDRFVALTSTPVGLTAAMVGVLVTRTVGPLAQSRPALFELLELVVTAVDEPHVALDASRGGISRTFVRAREIHGRVRPSIPEHQPG
jgi:hypothetical protein